MKHLVTFLLCGALSASASLNLFNLRGEAPADDCCAAAATNGGQFCPLVERVKLTEAQKVRFRACCPPSSRQCLQIRDEIDEMTRQIEREICTSDPALSEIDEMTTKLSDLLADELKTRVHNILLVRSTLTDEQLQRLQRCCSQ